MICNPAGMLQLLVVDQGVDLGFDDDDINDRVGLALDVAILMTTRMFDF